MNINNATLEIKIFKIIIDLFNNIKSYFWHDNKIVKKNIYILTFVILGFIPWVIANLFMHYWTYPMMWGLAVCLILAKDKYGFLKDKVWSPTAFAITLIIVFCISFKGGEYFLFSLKDSWSRLLIDIVIGLRLIILSLILQIFAYLLNNKKLLKLAKKIIIFSLLLLMTFSVAFLIAGSIRNIS